MSQQRAPKGGTTKPTTCWHGNERPASAAAREATTDD